MLSSDGSFGAAAVRGRMFPSAVPAIWGGGGDHEFIVGVAAGPAVTFVAGTHIGSAYDAMEVVAYVWFGVALVDLVCERSAVDIFRQGFSLEGDDGGVPARSDDVCVKSLVLPTSQVRLD